MKVQVKLTEFADLIDGYTVDYVGRKWLVKEIDSLLADSSCRIIVLTGGPGVGKSAFMAHLAATNPQWLRYFIRRDSRYLLRPGDGKTFFLTIGGQLATLRPDLFKPERLEVVVRQRIGDLASGGEVVAGRIEELRASPFYSVAIQIEQEIKRVAGKATGLAIGRLVTEPRLLTLQDLQHLGLLYPAGLLYQTDPEARVIVLVDALDELRFSPAETNILEALSQLPTGLTRLEGPKVALPTQKLPVMPPNLRFIVTSRREKFLDRLLGRSDVRELPLNVAGDDNRADLRAYTVSSLPEDRLEPALARENRTSDGFVADLLDKAAGNFLYLRSVLAALKEALTESGEGERLQNLLQMEQLPDNLDSLYDYFLNSAVNWTERSGFREAAWREYLRPLLGVLSVAREPLTAEQLLAFTDLDSEDLGDLLRELRQFVEPMDGGHAFQIYHTSFAEYLLDVKSNVNYRINGRKWNQRIVDFYRGQAKSWKEVDWDKADDYGVRHLGTHLYAIRADPANSGELFALLCKPYMRVKLARTGSHRAFAQDIDLALEAAQQETPPPVIQVARACLVYATLSRISAAAPPELLAILALLDERTTALGYAALISDAEQRCKSYLAIAAVISTTAKRGDLLHILDRALQAAEAIRDEGKKYLALGSVAEALAKAGEHHRALAIVQKVGYPPSGLVEALIQVGNYDWAFKIAGMIEDKKEKAEVLCQLAQTLYRDEQVERAQVCAKHALQAVKMIADEWTKVRVLKDIAETLAQVGENDRAFAALDMIWDETIKAEALRALAYSGQSDRAAQVVQTLGDQGVKLNALAGLAEVLARTGQSKQAQSAARKALELWKTTEIGSSRDQIQARLLRALVRTGEYNRVDEVVGRIGDKQAKAKALTDLAEVLVQIREVERAKHVAERVLDLLTSIEDELSQVKALIRWAEELTLAGEHDRALKVVETIEHEGIRSEAIRLITRARMSAFERAHNPPGRRPPELGPKMSSVKQAKEKMLGVLAQAMVQEGKYDEAFEVVETIKDKEIIVETLTELAWVLTRRQQDKRAQSAAKRAFQALTTIGTRGQAQKRVALLLAQAGELDQALEVVETISADTFEGQVEKASVLHIVVQALMQTGQRERARNATSRALRAVKTNKGEGGKAKALGAISLVLTRAGQYAQALEAVEMIRFAGYIKAESLISMAQASVQGGQVEAARDAAIRAVEVIKTSGTNWLETAMLTDLAEVLAQTGKCDRVLEVVQRTVHERDQAAIMMGLIGALVQSGENTRASEMATKLEDGWAKEYTLRDLARTLAHAGEYDGAFKTVEAITYPGVKAQALGGLAVALAQKGQEARALRTIKRAFRLARSVRDITGRNAAIHALACALVRIGEYDWTFKVVEEIDEDYALRDVAEALLQAREYDRAFQVVEIIKWEHFKVEALSRLAEALLRMGERERARSAAKRALEMARAVEGWRKADMLRDVIVVLAETGQHDRALEVVRLMKNGRRKEDALKGVSVMLAETGQHDRAYIVAETINDEQIRAETYTRLAQVLVQAGQLDRALEIVETIVDEKDKAEAMTMLAQVVTQSRSADEAHRLVIQALNKARLHSRDTVFSVLSKSVDSLAQLEGPEPVWGIAQAIAEIDSW